MHSQPSEEQLEAIKRFEAMVVDAREKIQALAKSLQGLLEIVDLPSSASALKMRAVGTAEVMRAGDGIGNSNDN